MAFPHRTAPIPNLGAVVTLPPDRERRPAAAAGRTAGATATPPTAAPPARASGEEDR